MDFPRRLGIFEIDDVIEEISQIEEIYLTSSQNAKHYLSKCLESQKRVKTLVSRLNVERENECLEAVRIRPAHVIEVEVPKDRKSIPVELEEDENDWERVTKLDPISQVFQNDELLKLVDINDIRYNTVNADGNVALRIPRTLVIKLTGTQFKTKDNSRILTYTVYRDARKVIEELREEIAAAKKSKALASVPIPGSVPEANELDRMQVPSIEKVKSAEARELIKNYKELGLVRVNRKKISNRSNYTFCRPKKIHVEKRISTETYEKFYVLKKMYKRVKLPAYTGNDAKDIDVKDQYEEERTANQIFDHPSYELMDAYKENAKYINELREKAREKRRELREGREPNFREGKNLLSKMKDFFRKMFRRKT